MSRDSALRALIQLIMCGEVWLCDPCGWLGGGVGCVSMRAKGQACGGSSVGRRRVKGVCALCVSRRVSLIITASVDSW